MFLGSTALAVPYSRDEAEASFPSLWRRQAQVYKIPLYYCYY
ncbi:MAG: hypothetical protein P9L91_07630 [Candidatus Zophobacter franzmannii]|nr:hypothetical protein [Candidatus Zophobacter franzmannii]